MNEKNALEDADEEEQDRSWAEYAADEQTQGEQRVPNIHDMIGSKYLKKEDVGEGVLVTIAGVEQRNLAMQGEAPELKWCMSFAELEKPMVLNPTNLQLCAQATGLENTEDWTGQKVVLYTDPNVTMAGKLVGGIRIRKPRLKPAAAPQPVTRPKPPSIEDMESDIPF